MKKLLFFMLLFVAYISPSVQGETIEPNLVISETADDEEIKAEEKTQMIVLKGIITDKRTGQPIKAAVLYEKHKIMTNDNGVYEIEVEAGKKYMITPNANNYISESFEINIPSNLQNEEMEKNMALTPIE